MKSKYIIWGVIIGSLFLLLDFTPRIHKEILIAQKYIESQEYQKSIIHYSKILKGNPNRDLQIKIYYQLGDLYSIYLAEYMKSLNNYKKVIKLTDDLIWMVKTEERIGEVYFNFLKDYESAVITYRKLSQFTPELEKQDFYQYRYALSYFHLGKFNKARNILNKIKMIKKHDYHSRSLYHIGLSYFSQENWVMAIKNWKSYIEVEDRRDNIIQAKFLMANAYETMEDLKKAYNIYYSLLGEYPNTEVIKNRLQSIYDRKVARKR